jgi:hypothetical protein
MDPAKGHRCTGKADSSGYCPAHEHIKQRERLGKTKHAIFAKYYDAEEVATILRLDKSRDARLDLAVGVAFVTLQRALKTWEEYRTAQGDPPLELVEQHFGRRGDAGDGTGAPGDVHETLSMRRARPDLWAIVDRCLGRIGHLIQQQQTQVEEVKELEGRLETLLGRLEPEDAAGLGHRLMGKA